MKSSGSEFFHNSLSDHFHKFISDYRSFFPISRLVRSLVLSSFSLFLTLLFIAVGSGSSEACTPTIEHTGDGNLPDIIKAGSGVRFSWYVKNSSSCDVKGYRLKLHSISPGNSATFSENSNLTFDLASNETGKLVEADMPEAPMIEDNYRVEFDIYTENGELLPVPDGWERLYATFEIRHFEADPTTLLAPENEEIIYTTTPTLDWEAVADATVYRAVVSDNSSFSGFDDDGSGTTTCVDSSCQTIKVDAPTTRYTVGQNDKNGDKIQLEIGKIYYWKVRDDASNRWSSVFKFTVSEKEPPPPSNCTARFAFVDDGYQPEEVAPGTSVDVTWKIKNISDCDAVGYHLGFASADPSGKNADYGGDDHRSFTIKTGDTGFVEANIRNTPEEEGEYRVEFDIYTNEDELLPTSSGGLKLFSEFTVTGDEPEPPPPEECTPSFVFVEDGYQPDPLEPGQSVDFTWKVKNTSDCDAEGYHLGFYSANPSSSTANYGGTDHQTFSLAAGATGFVTANVKAVPMEGNTYKVEFDIYTDKGEALPVPAGWERLYTQFTVDPCAKISEPKLENVRLIHDVDDKRKVAVLADVPDNGGQEVSLSLKLNDTIYEMSKLQSGGYGAAGWGNLTGDDTFLVTAANECYDTVFNFEDGSLTSYYHGTYRQSNCDGFLACKADPVSTYNGNFAQMFTDAAIAGIGNADLLIRRGYNSGAALADAASIYEYTDAGREKITGPAQYFGTGWSSNLDSFLLVLDYAPLYEGIQIRFPDGHTQNFDKDGSGYEASTPDNFDVLTQEGEEFLLERKHSLEKWRFGADGNLVEIQDRNGNTVTYTYTNGLLTTISEGNRSISFKHDADGHITEVALPEGIVLTYEYEEDLLVAMTDGQGNRTQYRYNEKKQLTEIVTPLGHSSVRMSYDDRHRVIEQTVGENELYAFAYQGKDAAEATTITDSYGNATVQKHDEEGRQKEIVHPDGSIEQFEYDEHNNRTYYKNPAGGEYRYSYDARGNRLTVDGPLGLHKEWEYSLRNLVTATTEKVDESRERSFTFDYDDNGNLKQFCLPLGDCGSITYDAHGLPVQMTDLRGNTTSNAYDAEGDLISVTDPEGAATDFSHDDLGRIIGKTKPLGNSYSYTYDNNSNLVAVDGPLGFHIGYEYDANNNLITSHDPNGGAIKYDWTASDSIAAVTNQLGFTSSFAYGLMNERTGRTDAEGRAWSYLYDNMLRVTDVSGPLGLHQSFAYNALGRITDATDPENRVKHVEYDALGRPLTVTRNYLPGAGEDADTNVTTAFTYDLLGNRLAVTDPEGYEFRAEYDLQNRLSKKQDAEGYEWEYSYDPMGNLLSVLNPRGYSTGYAYTPTNRLQSVINPEEHTKTLAYNANGKLTQVIDPNGIVTAFAYNELDRRSSLTKNYQPTVTPDQQTNVSSKFEYDAAGNLRFVTNPLNHQAEIRYDAAHRRSEMIDFEGGSTRFAYDKVNNLLTVIDAEGNATAYNVDELDRLIAVTNAENETTGYSYDLVGNRTTLTEADDTVTLYEFDGVYRLNWVHENYRPGVDPGNDVNAVTAYGYDRRGLLTGIVNANGAETLFAHNAVGKLIRETDPLNTIWEYAYDGNHNRISRQDGKGELTEYAFYPDDMLEQISYADASTVAYQYDANNNRVGMSDKLGETSWAFDSLNRVTKQNDPFARVLGYQYDAASNRIGTTYPDGNQVGYEYSPNSWLKTMTVGAFRETPLQTEYSRDQVGNLTQIVNPNQTETTIAYDKVYRTLERLNRQVTQSGSGKTNSGFKYTYNEVGHITEAIKEYGWRKPSVVTEAYEYDGLHRLAYMSMSPIKNNGGTVETAYNYDPVGNRLSWESNDDLQTNTPFDGFSRTYEYNAANQMLAMENAADKKNDDYAYEYSFDQNGNRINRQLIDRNGPQHGADYSYDPENRLTLVQDYQIVGGGNKKEEDHRIDRAFTTLEYDGGGRRLVQHYDPKQGGNGVDKRDEYVFDGLDPVAEYKMLNGQHTDYYRGAGNHLALMHQYKGGTQGQMYWYHYNNKGDVVGLTKHNGNSHHNYRYDPYGAVLPENGNFTDPHNHYTLTGKEFDENTGLVWFGSRHYEPETGVWMGQDSYRGRLSSPGSLHRFGYVGNSSLNYFDYYGYWPKKIHDDIIDQTFVGLPEELIDMIKEGSSDVDLFDPLTNYEHAMRDKGQSVEDAESKMNNFINKMLKKARSEFEEGDNKKGFYFIGKAMHSVMDSTSPSHKGFQEFNLKSLSFDYSKISNYGPYRAINICKDYSSIKKHKAAESSISNDEMKETINKISEYINIKNTEVSYTLVDKSTIGSIEYNNKINIGDIVRVHDDGKIKSFTVKDLLRRKRRRKGVLVDDGISHSYVILDEEFSNDETVVNIYRRNFRGIINRTK